MTDIDLQLALRFGHCSAVHAATLREAGGGWALDAVRENERLIAEIRLLRAIEEAARNLEDEHAEFDGLWVSVPILAKHWNELRAALAAKETP